MSEPTIFARATPPGRSAVAIVRISGDRAGTALRALCGKLPPPRRAMVATLRDPASGEALDRALVLWMPGPGTATGEDSSELHLHGGRAVVGAVLDALGRLPGLRAAEPGEFARRAFLNGKLDLAAAEGIAALIEAETAAQRRQALRQADGHLGRAVEAWRARLIELRAFAEAAIDFSDEEDVGDPSAHVRPAIAALAGEIEAALAGAAAGERLREGVTVVVAGRPNAGKSSLLNKLAGRDAAIVTEIPGTTRDPIEVQLDLSGLPVTLVDTAGLRETEDIVEREGVARARRRVASADLVLWVTDARAPDAPAEGELAPGVPVWVLENKIDLVARLAVAAAPDDAVIAGWAPASGGPRREEAVRPLSLITGPEPVIQSSLRRQRLDCRIKRGNEGEELSRVDAAEPQFLLGSAGDEAIDLSRIEREAGLLRFARNDEPGPTQVERVLGVSCTTGEGLIELVSTLQDRLADLVSGGETALVAETRQRRALEDAASALAAAESEDETELLAENLRRATDALGRITGRVDVEQVLDAVFSRFCIGK